MTSPVNYVDPTGHMAMHNLGGGSSVVVVPEPESTTGSGTSSGGSGAGSGTVKLSDGRTVSSHDEGVIVPSMTDLYYDTLEIYNQQILRHQMYQSVSFVSTRVFFEDYTYNCEFYLGFSGGYTYAVNLNEGWVAEYEHVGPYLSIGILPVSGQWSTGMIYGDMKDPVRYEGFYKEITASAAGSYTNAVSFLNGNNPRISQEGGGFETNVGITANASYYTLINIIYTDD